MCYKQKSYCKYSKEWEFYINTEYTTNTYTYVHTYKHIFVYVYAHVEYLYTLHLHSTHKNTLIPYIEHSRETIYSIL